MQETTEKKETAKDYFKFCFSKRTLIQKGIIAAIALALVLIFSLAFFFWLKDKSEGTVIGQNGFWYVHVIWNKGIGWSALENNPAGIYTIQSIMFILLLAIYLLLANDRITASFVALAIFGGLFNLFQRAGSSNDAVLDYFKFGFWPTFPIFNWPDIFVVIGIFGFVISYIVLIILDSSNEKHKKERAERKLKEEAKNNSSSYVSPIINDNSIEAPKSIQQPESLSDVQPSPSESKPLN